MKLAAPLEFANSSPEILEHNRLENYCIDSDIYPDFYEVIPSHRSL